MEMVRDQSSIATAEWTGFQSKPCPKHIVEKAIAELPKKHFFKQVINFLCKWLHPRIVHFYKFCTCMVFSFIFCVIQKKKKVPAPLPTAETSAVLTKEAEEMGLTSSTEATLLSNFIKRHFFHKISFVSNMFFHA